MKTMSIKVKGMTCSSCEVILERELKTVEGVHKVEVSRAKELVTVHCEDSVQLEDLQAKVLDKGYQLISKDAIEDSMRPSFIVKNKKRYAEIGASLLFIIGVYLILNQLKLIPEGFGVTDSMSYGFVFVIGLVAATSTCLAVAGGLLLAVANKYNEQNPNLTGAERFKPHIWFNVGRVASYALFGGLIGALGSMFSVSLKVTGVLVILASLFMILMGIQLLEIFPWANKIQLKMPKFIAHKIYDASHIESKKIPSKASSFLFGGATFFLPCGFTQALQLYVLSKGDFFVGAITMTIFALGTLPSLAGIGLFTSFSKGKVKKHFITTSAVLVIILGIFALPSGLTLVGVTGNSIDVGSSQVMSTLDSNVDKQIVELEVRGLDYYPTSFVIKKGVPVEWRVDGTGAIGCAQILSIPDMRITERLSRSEITTIEFTPTKTGKMIFSCSMGMAGPGVFEVI